MGVRAVSPQERRQHLEQIADLINLGMGYAYIGAELNLAAASYVELIHDLMAHPIIRHGGQ
jgi:hypothetical protein